VFDTMVGDGRISGRVVRFGDLSDLGGRVGFLSGVCRSGRLVGGLLDDLGGVGGVGLGSSGFGLGGGLGDRFGDLRLSGSLGDRFVGVDVGIGVGLGHLSGRIGRGVGLGGRVHDWFVVDVGSCPQRV